MPNNQVEQVVAHGLGRDMSQSRQAFMDSFKPEKLMLHVGGVRDPIGIDEQRAARRELNFLLITNGNIENAQGLTLPSGQGYEPPLWVTHDGYFVACTGVFKAAGASVEQAV